MAVKGVKVGLNGAGLLIATLGGLLVYAGLTGRNPIDALRDVTSGAPTGVTPSSAGLQASAANYLPSGQGPGGGAPVPDGDLGAALVAAARSFSEDLYSQPKRNQRGYSDCSSFVGKAYRAIGIEPPGGSTTGSYLTSPRWKKVDRGEVAPGDLAVTTSHMAIFVTPTTAIGQQNKRRNVHEGAVDDVMYPVKSFTCLRYAGDPPAKKPKDKPNERQV